MKKTPKSLGEKALNKLGLLLERTGNDLPYTVTERARIVHFGCGASGCLIQAGKKFHVVSAHKIPDLEWASTAQKFLVRAYGEAFAALGHMTKDEVELAAAQYEKKQRRQEHVDTLTCLRDRASALGYRIVPI